MSELQRNERGLGTLGLAALAVVLIAVCVGIWLVTTIIIDVVAAVGILGGIVVMLVGPKPYALFVGALVALVGLAIALTAYIDPAALVSL